MDRPLPPQSNGLPGDRPDALESALQRQKLRPPPAAWRDAILAAAVAASPDPAHAIEHPAAVNGASRPHALPATPIPARVPNPLSNFWERLHSGWTVLAGAWALVLTLNLYSSPAPAASESQLPPFSAATLAALRTQSVEIALLDSPDSMPPRRRSTPPSLPVAVPSDKPPAVREKPRAQDPASSDPATRFA